VHTELKTENIKRRNNSGVLSNGKKILSKWTFKEKVCRYGLDSTTYGRLSGGGCSECGNDPMD
jgi:hypothetical protein